jgi:hypothetical protein
VAEAMSNVKEAKIPTVTAIENQELVQVTETKTFL